MKSNQKLYSVYMHVNKINGKRYIGISHDVKRRWQNGSGYKLHVFGKAIEKYGWDNFDHIIVAENLSLEQAKQMEIELINKYQSKVHHNGYNVRGGGDMQDNLYVPILQFSPEGLFIKRYDGIRIAAKELNICDVDILEACKGKNRTSGGYIWRYEKDIEDIASFCKTINPLEYSRYLSIYMFDKNGFFIQQFKNQFEAAKFINPKSPKSDSIRLCCMHKRKTAYGYIWRYAFEVHDINAFRFSHEFQELFWQQNLIVYEFDIFGNFIQSYKNSGSAGKIKGVSPSSITYACNHHTLSCGSQWRRKIDCHDLQIDAYQKRRRISYVGQFDINHNLIHIFDNPLQVQEELGIDRHAIYTAMCRHSYSYGYYWEHMDKVKEVS